MGKKLISTEDDKVSAVLMATGVIAVAELMGGSDPEDVNLDECGKLATEFVDRVVKAEGGLEIE